MKGEYIQWAQELFQKSLLIWRSVNDCECICIFCPEEEWTSLQLVKSTICQTDNEWIQIMTRRSAHPKSRRNSSFFRCSLKFPHFLSFPSSNWLQYFTQYSSFFSQSLVSVCFFITYQTYTYIKGQISWS